MIAFIKSMDEKAWCLILTGWEPTTINDVGVKTPKSNATQTNEEDKVVNKNSKALNANFVELMSKNPREFLSVPLIEKLG